MKAALLRKLGGPLSIEEVPTPRVGAGELLLRVIGAGVCHSDLHLRSGEFPLPEGAAPPITLGHENAGVIEEVGAGVTRFRPGDGVAVWGACGCGTCRVCLEGDEPPCGMQHWFAGGGYAEYLLVPGERHLVPLDGLDPIEAAPLADAGLTPYRAIKKALPFLHPGATAVVIGVGGLGHLALQLLRAVAPWVRIVAVDVAADKLALATKCGADVAIDARLDAPAQIAELTRGEGARAVIDLVGSDASLRTAAAVVGRKGILAVVGLAGGTLPWSFFQIGAESIVTNSYWGSYTELQEVLALARTAGVRAHIETHPLERVDAVLDRLARGEILGRAVITP